MNFEDEVSSDSSNSNSIESKVNYFKNSPPLLTYPHNISQANDDTHSEIKNPTREMELLNEEMKDLRNVLYENFQKSALIITEIYKKNNVPYSQFQEAATAIATLYTGGANALAEALEKGKRLGELKHRLKHNPITHSRGRKKKLCKNFINSPMKVRAAPKRHLSMTDTFDKAVSDCTKNRWDCYSQMRKRMKR
ncbi:hypothetical protein SNEBB_003486 [Seison nebaliae]|nr:hypothetical protein SNEBB_003486 [Seison nebaliae]